MLENERTKWIRSINRALEELKMAPQYVVSGAEEAASGPPVIGRSVESRRSRSGTPQ